MKNEIKLEYARKRPRYHPSFWTPWRITVLIVLLLFVGPCGFVLVYDLFASIVNAIYRATR